MALAFVAGAVATAIIENLVKTCLSYLKAYPAALRGAPDELERLQRALPKIQTVLTAVEEAASIAEQNEALNKWLWQLRDAVENAEDVLDELEYYELKNTMRDRDDKVRGILSKCKKKLNHFVGNRKFNNDTLKRLREAVKGLDSVVAGMGPLVELVTGLYGPDVKRRKLKEIKKDRETTCLLTDKEVLGRDNERDLIVEWLIKPGDADVDADVDVSAFTIVGMGGLGKTTLARLVYHDKRVREYFDPIMWVCVSQDFDAAVIIRKMLEDVPNESLGDKSLNALHRIVEQKLTSKRFLLILDDVWNDDKTTEWEKLVAPLKSEKRGCKILLTTRMGSVADMAAKVTECKRESLNLNELEESDCLSLFNKHAFFGVNHNDYKNLQPIGERIAKKLGGCPLAIKVIGGMLNSCMDCEYWKKILEEDIMRLQQGNDGITTILRLSYDHLPTNLQLCFRYCSLFPQDYEFTRKELVNMWIGSGLIPQSICGSWRPEDIGSEYFDLLIKKSFFTCNTSNYGFKISKDYFMHDLLHDLARSVSQGECIRIEGEKIEGITIPQTVRHLSAKIVDLLSIRKISNLKNIRTLVISNEEDNEHNADHALEFIEVIKGFKKLRLLTLDMNIHPCKLFDALSSLIHLRYLSLSLWNVVNESIKYDGLTNLVNLRSLDVADGVIENIPYISKLPFINKLENFIVREESGYKIGELKNLKDLRHLCIKKLENVRTSEEVFEAKLNKKEYLKSLSLQWSADRPNSAEADEELLNNLCPHVNLKKLHIEEYQGAKSPCWMTDLSLINLTSIELNYCKGWEHLPPLGQFSLLQCLGLRGLHAIKQIDCSFFESSNRCAFPSLKELSLRDMHNLEWIGIIDGCMFPQLYTMEIIGCPNLTEIPTLPCSLRNLEISDVGLTALPTIKLDYADNNQQEHFWALEHLTIENCEKLEYLPTEYFGKFNAIKYLKIVNCPKLRNRGSSDIQLPSALNQLTIGSCGDLEVSLLQSLPNLTSLTALALIGCASMTSLPPAQVCARWTMLSHLTIVDCKELSSLGGIQALVSLWDLQIRGCDKLVEAALLLQPPFPNDAGQKNVEDCFLKHGDLWIDHHALLLMEPLRSLSSISWLILLEASQPTSLPEECLLQNHAALKKLHIYNAASLQSLPESMTKLCSLKSLLVQKANLIQSIPDLPASLCYLRISGCHPVLKERCQENIGLDWPKIAHIPTVSIS